MELGFKAKTQAERAIEALHTLFHQNDDYFHYHNIQPIEARDQPALVLYLQAYSNKKLPSYLRFDGGELCTGIAIVGLRRSLQLHYCLLNSDNRLMALAHEATHELPYKGTKAGKVLELMGTMGLEIPVATIKQGKNVPIC